MAWRRVLRVEVVPGGGCPTVFAAAFAAALLAAGCVTTRVQTQIRDFADAAVRNPQVLVECSRALADRPHESTTKLCLADAYYNSGDLVAAQEAYRDYLRLNPRDQAARLDLIHTCLARRQPDAAKAEASTLLAQNSASAQGYYYLGRAEAMLGNCAGATAAYERSLALDPGDGFKQVLLDNSKRGKCREEPAPAMAKAKPKARAKRVAKQRSPQPRKRHAAAGKPRASTTAPATGAAPSAATATSPPAARPDPAKVETVAGPFEHHPASAPAE
jgi:tetratricopeptide (TPR) repeat protein